MRLGFLATCFLIVCVVQINAQNPYGFGSGLSAEAIADYISRTLLLWKRIIFGDVEDPLEKETEAKNYNQYPRFDEQAQHEETGTENYNQYPRFDEQAQHEETGTENYNQYPRFDEQAQHEETGTEQYPRFDEQAQHEETGTEQYPRFDEQAQHEETGTEQYPRFDEQAQDEETGTENYNQYPRFDEQAQHEETEADNNYNQYPSFDEQAQHEETEAEYFNQDPKFDEQVQHDETEDKDFNHYPIFDELAQHEQTEAENYNQYPRFDKQAQQDEAATRIIGGDLAKRGQFPYIAYIICNGAVRKQCGGALITPEWILTAGHCLDLATWWDIKLGGIGVDKEEKAYYQNSTTGIPYPKFSTRTLEFDAGLIKLPVPATLSQNIQTIRLPARSETKKPLTNIDVVVSGWGQVNDTSGSLSQYLKYAKVKTISKKECKASQPPYFNIFKNTLCTKGQPKNAHCYGDSGGPLVRLDSDGKWTLIGIVSAGPSVCSEGPSTYQRVDLFLDWIAQVTGIAIKP